MRETWAKKRGWLSPQPFSVRVGRCITAAVYALAMAMLGVSGRAPSMRSLTIEKPPLSTTTIVTGLPISIALRWAAATRARASASRMLMPRSPQPFANCSFHRGGGLGVQRAMIDKLDHRAVGIGDVAELRIVLRALDRPGVAYADALEMLEKAIPVLDFDREVRRRHPAPVFLRHRREVQIEVAAREQQNAGITLGIHLLHA